MLTPPHRVCMLACPHDTPVVVLLSVVRVFIFHFVLFDLTVHPPTRSNPLVHACTTLAHPHSLARLHTPTRRHAHMPTPCMHARMLTHTRHARTHMPRSHTHATLAHTRLHTHAHTPACTPARTPARPHPCIHSYMHARLHARPPHARTQTPIRTLTHARTPAHSHATPMHACSLAHMPVVVLLVVCLCFLSFLFIV